MSGRKAAAQSYYWEGADSKPVAILHRSRNKAAIHLRNGPTQYMTATEAKQLGAALLECAEELEGGVNYTDSQFGTHNVLASLPFYESDSSGNCRKGEE